MERDRDRFDPRNCRFSSLLHLTQPTHGDTMTTDSGKQTPLNLGPECKCNTTEARCAWVGGCCRSCGHWDGYDDNGDELPAVIGRPTSAHCGSESGYQRHRKRREAACLGCRREHSRHNLARKASA